MGASFSEQRHVERIDKHQVIELRLKHLPKKVCMPVG